LVLALAVTLLSTVTASAHFRHSTVAMPVYPVMGAVGVIPAMPIMGGINIMPTLPVGTSLGTAGGGSLAMSMAMSGDASTGLVGLLMMRGLLNQLLAGPGAGGLTDAQIRGLEQRIAALVGPGMTANQAAELINAVRALREEVQRLRKGEDSGKQGSAAPARSPELERARARVRRLLDEIAALQKAPATPARAAKPNPEAEVRRLLDEIAALQKAPATPDRPAKANPEAEVRRLLGQIAAAQAGWKEPARTAVAVRGK
jgi:hypothetical protein